MDDVLKFHQSRKLIRYGLILFLAGLITGFLIPLMKNPRMGLSSHLEGTLNGILLIVLGSVWIKFHLKEKLLKIAFILALFGTYTNWLTTLLAGFWGAGSAMMPFAGGNLSGENWQEFIIKTGLISLSVSMIAVCGILIYGIRGNKNPEDLIK